MSDVLRGRFWPEAVVCLVIHWTAAADPKRTVTIYRAALHNIEVLLSFNEDIRIHIVHVGFSNASFRST